jgi:hypothetical protein
MAILVLGIALTGCTTSKKYRMVKKEAARPAPLLNWTASGGESDLALHSVIVFMGAGSWKHQARWDEYVVSIGNRGPEPLVIDAAVLIDVIGVPREWGVDPWELEALSSSNWEKYGKTGLKLVAGAGAVVIYTGVAVMTTTTGMFYAGATGAAVIGTVIPVAFLANVAVVTVKNSKNKKAVQAEFRRRLLPLPLTVLPGQKLAGSLFFPMTPGPTKLLLRGHRGGQQVDLVLDLKPFAALHLKPVEEAKTKSP